MILILGNSIFGSPHVPIYSGIKPWATVVVGYLLLLVMPVCSGVYCMPTHVV